MITGEFFSNRLVRHMEDYGYRDKVKLVSDNSVDLLGIYLTFDVGNKLPNGERNLEIILEDSGKNSEKLFNHLEKMGNSEFQKEKFPPNLRRKMKRDLQYFNIKSLENSNNGTYKINAKLKTQNEDKAFFALYNNFVRSLLVYSLEM